MSEGGVRGPLVVIEALSDDLDFFLEFKFLAFHRRKPHHVGCWPSGLIFNDKIQFPVPGVEFAKPLLDSHRGASCS